MKLPATFIILAMFGLTACQTVEDPVEKYASLPHGNVVKGRAVFINKECVSCHDVRGEFANDTNLLVIARLVLPGRLAGKSDEEWVKAIIHPRHVHDNSRYEQLEELTAMMIYADSLTRREMSDLIAFLNKE